MKVVLWPYYSQQCKQTDRFKLDSDSGVRWICYAAGKLLERGDVVRFVTPEPERCIGPSERMLDEYIERNCLCIYPRMPISNLDRRLHWDVPAMRMILEGVDLLITTHEHLAFPASRLFPELKVAVECGLLPGESFGGVTDELFSLSWAAADLVFCNSSTIQEHVNSYASKTSVWRFGYDDSLLRAEPGVARDIDVLFNARCSSVGYTNHETFLGQFRDANRLHAIATDPTSYLRAKGHDPLVAPEPLTRAQYIDTLRRSKVVLGLTDNGYGGYAFQEAVACGCCPVALRTPAYEELLTPDWPFYCTLDGVAQVASKATWQAVGTDLVHEVQARIKQGSYSAAWAQASKDIEELMRC